MKALSWKSQLATAVLLLGSSNSYAATDCSAVTQIPKAQCDALVSLYTNTNGAKWTDAATNNWNVTNTPCSWTGVVCNGGNVTELNRAGRGLVGALPDLSALTGLQNLWLYSNAITGDIAILKGLSNLRALYLGSTSLRGFLGDLTTLTQLEELNLASVPLATPMSDLSSFKKLRILSLYNTGMVGLIPSSLSGLTNLESLDLWNNQLVGNIPNLSALTKLSYLRLGYNNLTGSIPDLSNLTRLGYAYFQNNQLSGDIPASLGALPAPAAITLSNNKLCIPSEPLLSQLNLKVIPTNDTTWTTTQKSTNCGIAPPASQFSLSVTATNGSVSCNGATCQASYPVNTAITLTATPNTGYKFDGWSGDCSGTSSCAVTMTTAKSVIANFSAINNAGTISLSVTVANGSVSCNGTTCQTSYPINTAITLTATPNTGYKFDSWSGDCSGTSACAVTMTAAKSVIANFSAINNTSTTTGKSTDCPNKHAVFDTAKGLLTIPAVDIPTLDPITGESTGTLATFTGQLNLIKGIEDFGLVSDSFKVVKVDVTQHDQCNAEYFYADGKYSKGGTLHLPYVDVPSVIVIPPNVQVPGTAKTYDATLKQLALDLMIFHIADYKLLP